MYGLHGAGPRYPNDTVRDAELKKMSINLMSPIEIEQYTKHKVEVKHGLESRALGCTPNYTVHVGMNDQSIDIGDAGLQWVLDLGAWVGGSIAGPGTANGGFLGSTVKDTEAQTSWIPPPFSLDCKSHMNTNNNAQMCPQNCDNFALYPGRNWGCINAVTGQPTSDFHWGGSYANGYNVELHNTCADFMRYDGTIFTQQDQRTLMTKAVSAAIWKIAQGKEVQIALCQGTTLEAGWSTACLRNYKPRYNTLGHTIPTKFWAQLTDYCGGAQLGVIEWTITQTYTAASQDIKSGVCNGLDQTGILGAIGAAISLLAPDYRSKYNAILSAGTFACG